MKYIVVIETGDDPAVLGPFVSRKASEEIGKGLEARWGLGYSVHPVYRTIGEYLREVGDVE